MKNLIMILLASSFVACSPGKDKKEEKEAGIEKQDEHKNDHQEALSLNQGNKWKLDDATRNNMRDIKMSMESEPAPLPAALREKTDKLVRECRMGGPDHDALHLWLENFLADLRVLEETKGGPGSEAYKELREDLEEFDNFFE
jgi:hypothetical protein